MKKVLSTKLLSQAQKAILEDAAVLLSEYDAIRIEHLPFAMDGPIKNAIFTSKNAVFSLQNFSSIIDSVFCVGEKTAAELDSYGFNILEKADNASELAQKIVQDYPGEAFTFFCGNLRREELPTTLYQHNIPLVEIEVYQTLFNKKTLEGSYDSILFFSPSAVQSFTAFNTIEEAEAVCIGPTTAEEAKKHTKNIRVADRPTIEHTLQLLKKNLC